MKFFIYLAFFFYMSESFLFAGNSADNQYENTNSAIIFTYHRFGEKKYPSTNIRLEQFEYQLNYLQDNNYTVWPLSKIINYFKEKKKIPSKTVAICMDDAYVTVYTNAYPMLKKRGFPFTVFVNTMPIIHKSKRYMTWDQMREMSANGAHFANHTYSHAYLTQKRSEDKKQWEKRVKKEIVIAEEKMRQELGASVEEDPKMLAYPFGEYSVELEKLLVSMDYVGISQVSGPFGEDTSLTRVPRFPMSETYATTKGFLLKINTVPLPIASIKPQETMLKGNNPPTLRIKLKQPHKDMLCYKSSGDKIDMKWISSTEVEIKSRTKLKLPRDHYTCTAKAKDGKWYWYSHLWVFQQR